MKDKTKYGFTLVELLIVTVILAIISLAIFSTFSNGIKIYNRINSEGTLADLVIFCDRFSLDLSNCINNSLIKFIGKPEELEFASVLNSPRMQKRTVSRIRYAWDSSSEKIKRFTYDYSGVYNQEEVPSRQSLDKIKSCVFRYYYLDNQTRDFAWAEEWNKESLPVAVRMEVELTDNLETKITRTFNIPIAAPQNDTKEVQQ
jgi:prepilin-type N-terminal cleavage/methylation domain-containing protein